MKRLSGFLLLAGMWPGSLALATDPALLPTIPQIPAPDAPQEREVKPATGVADRIMGPIRERTGLTLAGNCASGACDSGSGGGASCGTSVLAGSPVKSWIGSHLTSGHEGRGPQPCGSSVCQGSPIKAWVGFCPTTGRALPWLNPQPYIGPVAGTFPCTSSGCTTAAGCNAAGCNGNVGGQPSFPGRPERTGYWGNRSGIAAGGPIGSGGGIGTGTASGIGTGGNSVVSGGGGPVLPGRGCNGNGGTCVPPTDAAFPGYHFAAPESPSVTGKPFASTSAGYTSYKPAVPPTGMTPAAAPVAPAAAPAATTTAGAAVAPAAVPQVSQRSPTVLEALRRVFARP
jgi:hypothetical protein